MIKNVLFGKNYFSYNNFDIMKVMFNDVIGREDVVYYEPHTGLAEQYLDFFENNEWCMAIKRHFFVPFKNLAYRTIIDRNRIIVDKTDTICFIFFAHEKWFFGKNGFLNYLRHRFRNAKLIYLLTNVNKYAMVDIEEYKKVFDLVATDDVEDAKKYFIPYYTNPLSKVEFKSNNVDDSDCFFVGAAKDRLEVIQEIYRILSEKGIRCDFHIVSVPNDQQKYSGIHYNKPLNYDEILKKVEKTKVILEILQEGQFSATQRLSEAVVYGKKLITNSKWVLNTSWYNSGNIFSFSSCEDIEKLDPAFFSYSSEVIYNDSKELSPDSFMEFIKTHTLCEENLNSIVMRGK